MVLDRISKTSIPQRVLFLVLGTNRPNLLTRLSVIGGFLLWIYFFSWHLMTFLSIVLMGNLKHAPEVRAAYGRIGYQYHYSDTINRLTLYSAIEILIYFIILIALILIWRRKKTGIMLYIFATISGLLVTFIIMGINYMRFEISLFDYILILASLGYFVTGFFIFYRKSSEPTIA